MSDIIGNQEVIPLDYGIDSKVDNRGIGYVMVMFEDMDMNQTSPLKFLVDTSSWRKLQGMMGLGDYGGKFRAHDVMQKIDTLVDRVEEKQLSHDGDMASLYAQVLGIENGMVLIQKLRSICEVAEKAGVEIRAVNAGLV